MSNPMPSTQHSSKQQAIIDATSRLIIEKGVENTSLADIANAVGISKGTLYYYYASKSDLIFDVTEQHFTQITEGLFAWVDTVKDRSDPREIFKVVLETILEAKTRARLHIYLIQAVSDSDTLLRERVQQKYQEWHKMIEAGLTAIFGESENHEALAALVLAALDGFVIQSHLGIDPIPVEAVTGWLATKI
ncbi:MAG: TetR/AcrR family transcriptional regulator [Anaerolineae bacterium]|nr:TetR/AcrR family transcriptional regulator [Anaerolineae bacterium]